MELHLIFQYRYNWINQVKYLIYELELKKRQKERVLKKNINMLRTPSRPARLIGYKQRKPFNILVPRKYGIFT